ncbi:NADH-dependent [FeFe] hydrogenase, group A6 [Lentisphaerota bacterium WC36G]|nr:[FeFe] hydrogenase, group A [Lentisphaerae bacterium WC36]
MSINKEIIVNGITVAFDNERNLLEVIRKAGIEIPTFCYHSELSIYGACRLCVVEVEGRGVMATCSTKPEPGMVIHTDTKQIRSIRKINIELLLANHDRECPSCVRSANCTLQDLARRLGVEEVRYKQLEEREEIDHSSPSLTRDPNKCVLCGDCVRVCDEVQGIGAIDFIGRGANAKVAPAFDQDLSSVECVNCGQCAAVCPTGAIIPKQDRNDVWDLLHDDSKIVVAQVAPAVRVGLGEHFGFEPGENTAGQLVNALKMMGFDYVFDTSFAADMTIFEEATEFLDRLGGSAPLPMFTSCCPAWVKFAEIYFPELLPNLSSCKSPQQMFGSVAKKVLPAKLNADKKDIVVVSIMPCTAKKYEATLDKFKHEDIPEVDKVLTTVEVGRMINSAGIKFDELDPEAFDMPLGFSTGAGVIFGATGGVMEAALRFAYEKVEGKTIKQLEFKEVRGLDAVKEATVNVGGTDLKVAVVYGLKKAKELAEKIRAGEADYHFVEVMACPGGCIAGAGQPITHDIEVRKERAKGLYTADKRMQLHKSQDNYMVQECYNECMGGEAGSHEAHHTLHTNYQNRCQIFDARVPVLKGDADKLLPIIVTICTKQENDPGQKLLALIVDYVKNNNLADKVEIEAAFTSRPSADGTIAVTVGSQTVERSKFKNAINTEEELANNAEFAKIKEAIDKELA